MFKQKKLAQKYIAQITVSERELPVEIIIESRRGSRFSITRKKIIMRVPFGVSSDDLKQELSRLQQWVGSVVQKRPSAITQFAEKSYQTGQELVVGQRAYILDISEEERASHTARLLGKVIVIRLSNKANSTQKRKAIQTLLSRVVAGDHIKEITKRVQEINNQTFKQPITNVYLKHNHSNWGSCSSGGNINLSTRLLFAPTDVQNYVILHELAHLLEMNHSDRFWALVEQHMPDYPTKERWLKENGGTCNF